MGGCGWVQTGSERRRSHWTAHQSCENASEHDIREYQSKNSNTFVQLNGWDRARNGCQKRAKTSRVLPGGFVQPKRLIWRRAGETGKNDRICPKCCDHRFLSSSRRSWRARRKSGSSPVMVCRKSVRCPLFVRGPLVCQCSRWVVI